MLSIPYLNDNTILNNISHLFVKPSLWSLSDSEVEKHLVCSQRFPQSILPLLIQEISIAQCQKIFMVQNRGWPFTRPCQIFWQTKPVLPLSWYQWLNLFAYKGTSTERLALFPDTARRNFLWLDFQALNSGTNKTSASLKFFFKTTLHARRLTDRRRFKDMAMNWSSKGGVLAGSPVAAIFKDLCKLDYGWGGYHFLKVKNEEQ